MNKQEFAALVANASRNAGGPVMVNGRLVNNANTTLRHDDHKRYDAKLIEISRQRLNGIKDLQAKGLTVNLGGLGVILSMYERVGDMTEAHISMDGKTRGSNDRLTFDEVGVPIPIFHEDWSLNFRHVQAAQNGGTQLPITQMATATRLVLDRMEKTLFLGAPSIVVDGKTIYGYTTHPDRHTGAVTAPWATATGEQIKNDVKEMLQLAYDHNKFGPFVVYVAKDIWANIQDDYSSVKGSSTIKQRIEAFDDVSEIKAGDSLLPGHIVMVQMTEDVVDLAMAQGITNLQWQADPMETQYKVFSAMAPRIKVDKNGNSGVVHYS